MVNGALHSRFCSLDLGFEQRDALLAFLDREGVEVLLAQLGGQIVLATRQIFIGVHGHSVDRGRSDVNNATGLTPGERDQ
jgi:hypothetical protein